MNPQLYRAPSTLATPAVAAVSHRRPGFRISGSNRPALSTRFPERDRRAVLRLYIHVANSQYRLYLDWLRTEESNPK